MNWRDHLALLLGAASPFAVPDAALAGPEQAPSAR